MDTSTQLREGDGRWATQTQGAPELNVHLLDDRTEPPAPMQQAFERISERRALGTAHEAQYQAEVGAGLEDLVRTNWPAAELVEFSYDTELTATPPAVVGVFDKAGSELDQSDEAHASLLWFAEQITSPFAGGRLLEHNPTPDAWSFSSHSFVVDGWR